MKFCLIWGNGETNINLIDSKDWCGCSFEFPRLLRALWFIQVLRIRREELIKEWLYSTMLTFLRPCCTFAASGWFSCQMAQEWKLQKRSQHQFQLIFSWFSSNLRRKYWAERTESKGNGIMKKRKSLCASCIFSSVRKWVSWCTAILKSFASDGCLATVEGNTEKIFQVSIEPSARYSPPFLQRIYLQLGFFLKVLRFSPLIKNVYLITSNLCKFSLQCLQLAYP